MPFFSLNNLKLRLWICKCPLKCKLNTSHATWWMNIQNFKTNKMCMSLKSSAFRDFALLWHFVYVGLYVYVFVYWNIKCLFQVQSNNFFLVLIFCHSQFSLFFGLFFYQKCLTYIILFVIFAFHCLTLTKISPIALKHNIFHIQIKSRQADKKHAIKILIEMNI